MLAKYTTKNFKQTQKLGEDFTRFLLSPLFFSSFPRKRESRLKTWIPSQAGNDGCNKAVIIGLTGNLGGGKTTFLQGFAKGLGIKEKILSPTFVILKRFVIPAKAGIQVRNFYHIDCYRLKKSEDILELGFGKIISDPKNIVAIEWPERIKKVLPKNTIFIDFKFVDEKTREVNFK